MISLGIILAVLFTMFKVTGFIAWSWFWIVSPVIVAVLLELLVCYLIMRQFGGSLLHGFFGW